MALEDLVGPDKFLDSLVRENPEPGDPKSQGDDHIRGVKNTLLNTFPNFDQALASTPTDIDAAVAAYLAGTFPVGGIISWPALAAPSGNWALCDGAAVSRTTYAALFALLGETWGAGDGSTTFNLPDYTGRVLIGQDGATYVLAGTGGASQHALTVAQMPQHRHFTMVAGNGTGGGPDGNNPLCSSRSGSSSSDYLSATVGGSPHISPSQYQGSGAAFSLMNPWLSSNWAIHLGVPAT